MHLSTRCLILLLSHGCAADVVSGNLDLRDADTSDRASIDLGQSDASGDAGIFDVGLDAGPDVGFDAGSPPDAAHPDAAHPDAAHPDAASPDATPVDSGSPDAGMGYDPDHRVGMLYFVHHVAPTMAAQVTGSSLTTEQVIRGHGSFGNIFGGNPYHARALAHLNHYQPQIGFYCLFEPINDPTLPAAAVQHANTWSCHSNVGTVANTHAQQLTDAGVDFVVLDLSNPTTVESTIAGAGPLILALRPTQILFREWAQLTASGIPTPQIAAWAPIPTGATLWQRYLDLYNQYPDVAMRHDAAGSHSGKKVFFYVDSYDSRAADPSILAAIANNGGRNDVVPVPMWTHLNQNGSFGSTDRWAFMAPCMRSGQRTTSILGAPCNQLATPQSVIGSQITVGPSYQYEGGYASLPFQSPGKLGGLTLKKQFQTAIQSPRNYLLITGWNELSSGHWMSAYTMPDVYAVGLEGDTTYGVKQFVDAYGTEYSRDLEPSVENGTVEYDLLRSCVARYKTGTCAVVNGQDCCDLTEPFVNVYSLVETLHLGYEKRALVSTDTSEVQTFLSGHYRQVCNRYPGTVDFCVDVDEDSYQSAPFIAYTNATSNRVAVFRCHFTGSDKYFLTTTPSVECANATGGDTPAFYISANKTSETPRVLRRCYDSGRGSHFHAVGLGCPTGTEDAPPFGFVR